MGMYDTFGEHGEQLKVGDCILRHYKVGDAVDLSNGIYCGYDRAIVVTSGIFVADLPLSEIYDKWGAPIGLDIANRNPLREVIKNEIDRLEKDHETKENNL